MKELNFQNKREVRFYNVLFPIWLLMLYPLTWLIVIPGNFIVDSLVVLLGAFLLKIQKPFEFYKKNIFLVFIFGFISDFIGSLWLLLTYLFEKSPALSEYLTVPVSQNPYDNIYSLIYTVIAVLISGLLIYIFNRFVSLRKVQELRVKKVLSLMLALMTAPYLFLVPTSGIFGGQVESFTNHFVWAEYTKAEVYLAENEEVDILNNGEENFNFDLSLELKDGINTAKKTKKVSFDEWDYKVVFYAHSDKNKKLDPIYVYDTEDGMYILRKNKYYVISDEYANSIKEEIVDHMTPDVEDEPEVVSE